MATRVAVAAVGIPVIVGLALIGGYFFYLIVLVMASVALVEFYKLSERRGASPLKALGLLAGVGVVSVFFYSSILRSIGPVLQGLSTDVRLPSQWQLLLILFVVFVLLTFLLEIFRGKLFPMFNIASTVMGVLYISLPFGTLVGIREVFGEEIISGRFIALAGVDAQELSRDLVYHWGGYTAVSMFACIWVCDTAAQFVGLKSGKHKLMPCVSPNKSWEGAAAGLVAALGAALLAKNLVLPFLTSGEAIVIGLIVGVFGQAGDLAESLLKRDAGVKDSSNIIPGHGGMLDRFDSLLFVSPLVFLYFDFVLF